MKPRYWLGSLPLLLAAGALAAWAIPGSAAVLAPPAHQLPRSMAAQATPAACVIPRPACGRLGRRR